MIVGIHASFLGLLRRLGLFLLGFSLFHNFSVHLFQKMGDSIWQIEEEDDLVVLDFVQHLAAYDVGDPVVSEVVLCDRLVVFDDGDELFFNFLLDCVPDILLVVENIHLHIRQIQFFQLITTGIHSPEDFIGPFVFKWISHEFESPQLAIDIRKYLLDILHSMFIDTAEIERQLFNFTVLPQSYSQMSKTFIFDFVVVQLELNDTIPLIFEGFAEKLAAQSGDLIVHEIKILNGAHLVDIVADTAQAFILEINFPQPNHLQMLVVEIAHRVHEGSYLNGPQLLPQLQLTIIELTVSSFPSQTASYSFSRRVLWTIRPLNSHFRLQIRGMRIVASSSQAFAAFFFYVISKQQYFHQPSQI